MSEKEITVNLYIPIKLTVIASDESGDVRIKRIIQIHPPFVEDIMDCCSDDDLREIDQAFEHA